MFFVLLAGLLGVASTAAAQDMFSNVGPSWTKVQDKSDIVQWSRTAADEKGNVVRIDLARPEGGPITLTVRGKCPAGSSVNIWYATARPRNSVGMGTDCDQSVLVFWGFDHFSQGFTDDMSAEVEKYSK